MNGRYFFATLVALLICGPALALAEGAGSGTLQSVASDGPIKVTARVDKATARVAEPLHLVLDVEAPRGARIELPASAERLGDFEVRRADRTLDIPSPAQADKRSWVLRMTLETLKTGELTIPPLEIHYTADAASSTFKTLSTSPIQVHITSVLENRVDPTKFRDIKQTVDVDVPAVPSKSWIVWTGGGVAAAVAALLLTVVVVKRRRRRPAPVAWALTSIEELEQLAAAKTAGTESLFNETVEIVREFVELEFNVPALPRTTREFLADVSNDVGLPDVASKRLAWLASVADEIKFARLGVSEEHVQHAFAQAKAFVGECEVHRQSMTKGAA